MANRNHNTRLNVVYNLVILGFYYYFRFFRLDLIATYLNLTDLSRKDRRNTKIKNTYNNYSILNIVIEYDEVNFCSKFYFLLLHIKVIMICNACKYVCPAFQVQLYSYCAIFRIDSIYRIDTIYRQLLKWTIDNVV